MTLKTTKLRDAIVFALAVGATAFAGTGIAFAQDTPPPTDEDATELDRITVTGSRIKRTEVETSQPIFTLNREEIQAQGLTSVGDVIQNITANGSTLNSTFNNGGNGETRVSLRNLGSGRTLVLVNGRRWVGGTGLGGAVDLNTIPTAAVERIEVLKAGASAIYGSDAIAGVVNVILRTDYTGAEANLYLGVFDKGDGARQSMDFTVGQTGDRFSAMMGVGYVKEEPVFAGNRPISAEPVFGTGVSFGSSTSPFGRFALCPVGQPNVIFNQVTGSCTVLSPTPTNPTRRVNAEGRPGPGGVGFVPGGQFTYDPDQSGRNFRRFNIPGDFYNFAPDNYLLTPQERKSLFGRAALDLTDNIQAVVTATYNNRRSEQLLAAMPVVLGSGPGAGVQARTISISPDSIYNPFGLPVSRIQRRAVETGGRSFNQNVDTFGFNGGLEGSFERWDRYFTWDAGMVYGRNDQNDTTFGLFNVPALRQALGPSMRNAAGVPVCVTTPGNLATIIPGCVPLNLLGAPGTITPEMLNFVTFVAHDETGYKMKQYYANLTGEIAQLPGGMLAFAAGVEKRTESGFDQPDALINSGNTTGNARTATAGAYGVKEAYLELAIPVLKDVPFAQELEFTAATRYSDYSNFGDTVNSSFGFKWRPIEDLLVRGNWAEGFRAPAIGELFQGVSDSFPQIADPCNLARYPTLTPDAQARCRAQGVPAGGYDQGNPQIRISVGGNPNLLPETSTTKTLGLVWSPGFFEGFDVSLDWWNIELENTISAFGGATILNECIVNNNPAFCAQYQRQPGGAIFSLLSSGVNFGAAEVEGYDMTMNYRMPETAWGKFSFSWDSTYMAKYTLGDDDNLAGEYFDRFNNWRIRSNLLARWEMADWGATWFTRFYSRQDEDCQFMVDYGFADLCSDPDRFVDVDGKPTAAAENKMGGTTYHDASLYWKAPWNAKVTVGVNNIFEKEPPRSNSTFANSFDPQYEVPGQFFYVQYNQKF